MHLTWKSITLCTEKWKKRDAWTKLKTWRTKSFSESGDDLVIDEFPLETDDEQEREAMKEQESLDRLLSLFSECRIFLSREVPREALVFLIR